MTELRYEFADPPPFRHQRLALAKIAKLGGRCALLLPMRSGKSRAAIDWAGVSYVNFGLRRLLVVAPVSVVGVWDEQIAEFMPAHVEREIHVLTGTVAQKTEQVAALRRAAKLAPNSATLVVIIVNYDAVWRGRLEYQLTEWAPQLVIADEGHRIAKSGAKQSRAMWRIGEVAPMRLLLTGTAITNSPMDAYGELRFIDPSLWIDGGTKKPLAFSKWRELYGVFTTKRGMNSAGKEYEYPLFKQYQNLDELTDIISRVSFKRTLEECFDLPPKQYVDVPVKLSATTKKLYRQMATEMVAQIESGEVAEAEIKLTVLLRLAQISAGFVKVSDDHGNTREIDLDTAKLDTCLDLIDDMIAAGEKVVVFCRFKHDYHAVESALAHRKIGHVVFTGETPIPRRPALIRQFQTNPKTMVFLSQTATGSLGIDLTAARFVIFFSLDYRADHYWQAQDRVYGPKQPLPVTIHHLIANVPIDRVILRSLQAKTDLAKLILSNPRQLLDLMP